MKRERCQQVVQRHEQRADSQRGKKRRLTVDCATQHRTEYDRDHDVETGIMREEASCTQPHERDRKAEYDESSACHLPKRQLCRIEIEAKQMIENRLQSRNHWFIDSLAAMRSRIDPRQWSRPKEGRFSKRRVHSSTRSKRRAFCFRRLETAAPP